MQQEGVLPRQRVIPTEEFLHGLDRTVAFHRHIDQDVVGRQISHVETTDPDILLVDAV